MSLKYIRDTYRVPAKRGARILFDGVEGTITGAHNGRLRVRLKGLKRRAFLHPDWQVTYPKKCEHQWAYDEHRDIWTCPCGATKRAK